MLHAVIHNKKAQKRGHAWTLEDNVTSTFFGSLCFLDKTDVISLLGLCFPSSIEDLNNTYSIIEFDFWPNFKTDKGRIEPDLLIHFKNTETNSDKIDFLLLIEVKWQGYKDEHEEHQVHRQIDAIKKHLNPENMHAIYLTQYDDKQKPKSKHKDVGIQCVKWIDIASQLNLPLNISDKGKYWQKCSRAYLDRLLRNVFNGFTTSDFKKVPDFENTRIFFGE